MSSREQARHSGASAKSMEVSRVRINPLTQSKAAQKAAASKG
jgi:hypothetical protein